MSCMKEVLAEKGIKQTWLAEQPGKRFSVVNFYVYNRHRQVWRFCSEEQRFFKRTRKI